MNRSSDLLGLPTVLAEFRKLFPTGGIIALSGDLGAGKTTFVRELVRTLTGNPEKRVTSPTYVLHQSYPDAKPPVEHFDLYRLEGLDEPQLLEIGYFDAVDRTRASKGYLFVEWPEKATASLQLDATLTIEIRNQSRQYIIMR